MQLAPAFFKLPPPPQVFEPVTFPLPASVEDMGIFLVSNNAILYRQGIAGLVSRLKTWAATRNPQIPYDHDKQFLKTFDYSGSDKNLNEINFRLFSEGIGLLNNIVQKLESNQDLPVNIDEIIAELISNLNVCAPGVYIHLSKVWMALQTSLAEKLLTIRQGIVEAKAEEIVEKYHDDIYVDDGQIIHYVYSLVNLVVEPFGLRKIEDELSAQGSPVFGKIKREFLAATTHLWVGTSPIITIVTQILDNLDCDNILRNINKPNYSDFLEEQLNKYGPDPTFNVRFLFDDNALAEGLCITQPHIHERLITTLLNRLIKGGFITLTTPIIEFSYKNAISNYFHVKNGLVESTEEYIYSSFLSGISVMQILSRQHPDLFNNKYPPYVNIDGIVGKRVSRTIEARIHLRANVLHHLRSYHNHPILIDAKRELLKILLEPNDNPKILGLAPAYLSEYENETNTFLQIVGMFDYEDRIKILRLLPTHIWWIVNIEAAGRYLTLFFPEQWPALISLAPALRCVDATDLIKLLKLFPQENRIRYLELIPPETLIAMIMAEKEKFCELLNLVPVNDWEQAPLGVEVIRNLAHIAAIPLSRDKNPVMTTFFSPQVGGTCRTLLLLNSLNAEAAPKILNYFHFQGMHVYQLGLILLYLDLDKWPFLLEPTKQLLVFQHRDQLRSALESFYSGSPDKMKKFVSLLSSDNIIKLCGSLASMEMIVRILRPYALPAWIDKVGLTYMRSIVPNFLKYRELISIKHVIAAGPELLQSVLIDIDDWKKFLSYYYQPYLDECLKVLSSDFVDHTFKNFDDLEWVISSRNITNDTLFLLLSAFSDDHLRKIISNPHNLVILLNRLSHVAPGVNYRGKLLFRLGGKHLRMISRDKNLFYQAMRQQSLQNPLVGLALYLSIILNDDPDLMINELIKEYHLDYNFFEVIPDLISLTQFLTHKSIKQCNEIFKSFEVTYLERIITSASDLLCVIKNVWRPSALILLKRLNPAKLQAWFSESESLFTLISLFFDDHDSYYALGAFLMRSLKIFDTFEKIVILNRGQLMYVVSLNILKNVITTQEQLLQLLKNHDIEDWLKICNHINYEELLKTADQLNHFLSALDNEDRGDFLKELVSYDTPFSLYFRKLAFSDPANFAQLFLVLVSGSPVICDFERLEEMYLESSNIIMTLNALPSDYLRGEFIRFIYEDLVSRGRVVLPMHLPPYSRLVALARIASEIHKTVNTIENSKYIHSLYASGLLKRQSLLLQLKELLVEEVTREQVSRFEEGIMHDRVYLSPLYESVKAFISIIPEAIPSIELRCKRTRPS